MTVGITGADGFFGWHLRCRLFTQRQDFVVASRAALDEPDLARRFVSQSNGVVLHLAGVNRAASEDEIRPGNALPAQRLADAIDSASAPTTVIYANSVKADQPGVYGEAKAEAAEILRRACDTSGGRFVDIRFPHLFGEFGRPYYNSGVSTFAYELVQGKPSTVNDGELQLLHVQDAAQMMIDAVTDGACTQRPAGNPISVPDAYALLSRLAARYVSSRTFPELNDDFELRMFNMVRSQMWPDGYPFPLKRHADQRGAFFEATRALGQGQTSISTTVPGVVRGEHYHFDKVERFVVISGTAIIRVRRLFDDAVFEFQVDGTRPCVIDMPPLCTHDITNVGSDELVTLFWSHDHFDPARADTYPLAVTRKGQAA